MQNTINREQAQRLLEITEKALVTYKWKNHAVKNKQLTAGNYTLNVSTTRYGDYIEISLTKVNFNEPSYLAYLDTEGQEEAHNNGRQKTHDTMNIMASILTELLKPEKPH